MIVRMKWESALNFRSSRKVKTTTLIKSLDCVNAKLYAVRNGNRMFFGDCDVRIRIYEDSIDIPAMNSSGKVKSYHVALVIGDDINTGVDATVIESIRRYDLVADVRKTGSMYEYERISFDGINPNVIDLFGEWEFEILDRDMINKLMRI